MKYFVTHFTIKAADESLMQPSREILAAIVGECGYETFLDTEEGIDGYVQTSMYDEPVLQENLAEFPIENVSINYYSEEIEDQDWNATWEEEEGFTPICIDDQIVIYDHLHTSEEEIDRFSDHIAIGIEARNAFGTGTHETTRMMVSSLLSLDLEGKRVLDCGCGTGILAIAALRCGAAEAVGYDIDEWSVENSRHNATLNGVGDRITVLEGDATVLSHVSGVFEVVMANINRNILLADMESFREVMSHDATLLLSGFYEDDVQLLVNRASELDLSLVSHRSDGEWHCLRFSNK